MSRQCAFHFDVGHFVLRQAELLLAPMATRKEAFTVATSSMFEGCSSTASRKGIFVVRWFCRSVYSSLDAISTVSAVFNRSRSLIDL